MTGICHTVVDPDPQHEIEESGKAIEMKEVSVIIVNYNTKELTLECLRTLYQHTRNVDFEVLLVDNASSDGSVDAIRAEFPEVILIESEQNLGFGRANNLASETATGKYLLLLNSDTVTIQNSVGGILDFAEKHPEHGSYGVKTLYGDGSHNTGSCWGFPRYCSLLSAAFGLNRILPGSRLFNAEGYDWADWSHPFTVDAVSGCFLLISHDLWSQVRGFDEDFFMYGEDIDLALRLKNKGRDSIIDPTVEIVHLRGRSDVVKSAKWTKLFTAKSQLFVKHWPINKAKRLAGLLTLYSINRRFVLSVLRCFRSRLKESHSAWKEIHQKRHRWEVRKIFAIASGGGHWIQLLRIRPAFKGNKVVYATTIKGYADSVRGHKFYSIVDGNQKTKLKLILMAAQIFFVILKERPHFVVSTGAAPGFFAMLFGRALGAKTIWLDSIANADELSLSGRKVKSIASLYLTQWESLASENGPFYLGAVL